MKFLDVMKIKKYSVEYNKTRRYDANDFIDLNKIEDAKFSSRLNQNYEFLGYFYKTNLDAIIISTYLYDFEKKSMNMYNINMVQKECPIEVAAQWCICHYLANGSADSNSKFYVLLQHSDHDEKGGAKSYDLDNIDKREKVNILNGITEFVPFINKNAQIYISTHKNTSKEFYDLAYIIYSKIKEASMGKTIIGYTFSDKLAQTFADSLGQDFKKNFTEEIMGELILYLCVNKSGCLSNDDNMFKNMIGEKVWKNLPALLQVNIEKNKYPFESFEWELINYQIKPSKRIDDEVYNVLRKSEEVRTAIQHGDFIEGLDFEDSKQFRIIDFACKHGYLYEICTEDGWKSREEMEAWLNSNKEILRLFHSGN